MEKEKKKCFIIMPFTLKEIDQSKYRDQNHWNEVFEGLIVPAVNEAEMIPDRDDHDIGSRLIVENILEKIEKSDLILCDLSSHNPNVFLELGWALRSNKPYILIKDDLTTYTFDLNQQYTFNYSHYLQPTILRKEIKNLANVIRQTLNDREQRYSIIKRLSISFSAIEAINEGDYQVKILKEIQERMRNFTFSEKSEKSKLQQFPWPVLLIKATKILFDVMEFIKSVPPNADYYEIINDKIRDMGIKYNRNIQISILDEKRCFLYHDVQSFVGNYASYGGIDGNDIYDLIFNYPQGVLAWIDNSTNVPGSSTFGILRENIALFSTFNDLNWKIVVETHNEKN